MTGRLHRHHRCVPPRHRPARAQAGAQGPTGWPSRGSPYARPQAAAVGNGGDHVGGAPARAHPQGARKGQKPEGGSAPAPARAHPQGAREQPFANPIRLVHLRARFRSSVTDLDFGGAHCPHPRARSVLTLRAASGTDNLHLRLDPDIPGAGPPVPPRRTAPPGGLAPAAPRQGKAQTRIQARPPRGRSAGTAPRPGPKPGGALRALQGFGSARPLSATAR